jgi:hypothetical protein
MQRIPNRQSIRAFIRNPFVSPIDRARRLHSIRGARGPISTERSGSSEPWREGRPARHSFAAAARGASTSRSSCSDQPRPMPGEETRRLARRSVAPAPRAPAPSTSCGAAGGEQLRQRVLLRCLLRRGAAELRLDLRAAAARAICSSASDSSPIRVSCSCRRRVSRLPRAPSPPRRFVNCAA